MPKILNGVVSNKYDTSTNWAKATTFIPAKGETIYYKDPGMPVKFKVGDGVTLLSDLDFCTTSFTPAQVDAINSGITNAKRSEYDSHVSSTSNPHSVTKSQVGLGNADNKSEATIKSDFTGSIASGNTGFVTGGDAYTALNAKVPTSRKINNKALTSDITLNASDVGAAPLNSPAFTGSPTSTTPNTTDNSTKIATTAYVNNLIASALNTAY